MIIDAHTHVFPPDFIAQRHALLPHEPAFAAIYRNPQAAMVTATDVLAFMDAAGVDAAVICAFAWTDPQRCRRANDDVLEAAARSGGRLIPFCMLQPTAGADQTAAEAQRVAAAGARGIGELRPAQQGYRLDGGPEAALLADLAVRHRWPLLFHVSEPLGHAYPGKAGLPLHEFAAFVAAYPQVTVIGAHWGGGWPLYAPMPEIRAALPRTFVDTAATSLLYDDAIFDAVRRAVGADRILFGSDFPLRDPAEDLACIRSLGLPSADLDAILGGNAARLFGLSG